MRQPVHTMVALLLTHLPTYLILKIVSHFWRETFDFMSITSHHGIFIFQYEDLDGPSKEELSEGKAQLLQDLGQFKEKCITFVRNHSKIMIFCCGS